MHSRVFPRVVKGRGAGLLSHCFGVACGDNQRKQDNGVFNPLVEENAQRFNLHTQVARQLRQRSHGRGSCAQFFAICEALEGTNPRFLGQQICALSLSLSRAAKWSEEIQDVPRLITPHAHVITRTSRAQLAIFDLQPTVKNLHHLTAMVTAKVPWFKAQFG